MSHWRKLDHITFLLMVLLAIIGVFLAVLNCDFVNYGIFALLICLGVVAFIYDLSEHRIKEK